MVLAVDENCEFVVPQNRVEALVNVQQKIQCLFNVRVNVQSISNEDEVRWVTLEGDRMDRRQAMEYVNAVVKPEQEYVCKLPHISAYLLENYAIKENLEKTTLSLIEIVSDEEIKICGSQMAVATALSALEETVRIFGEDAVTNPLQIHLSNQSEDIENTSEEETTCEVEESKLSPECAVDETEDSLDKQLEDALCEKLDDVCLASSVVAETTSENTSDPPSEDLHTSGDVVDADNEAESSEGNKETEDDGERPTSHAEGEQETATENTNGPHVSLRDFAVKLGYTDKEYTQAINKREVVDQNSLLNELLNASSSAKQLEERTVESTVAPQAPYRPDPSNLRPIVIDGSNVAMSHGNHKVFSCRGIGYAVDWFIQRGHRQITVFVPKWRKEASRPETPIIDQEVLQRLEQDGLLSWTPSRPLNGRRVVCYDDRFIVKLAAETGGVIVSNDNFRDLLNENAEWKKVIQERLLMYSFANDRFMVPDDPSGRHGPRLDEFLCKGSGIPCPYGPKRCTYAHRCKFLHPERQKPEDSDGSKSQKEEFNVKKIPEIPYGEVPPSCRSIPPHILTKPLPPLPNEIPFSDQVNHQKGAVGGYQDIYSQMHLRLSQHFPPTLRGPRQGEPVRRQVISDPTYQHHRLSGDMGYMHEELHRVMSMPNLDTAGFSTSRRNSLTQVQDLQASGFFSSPTASPRNSRCSPAASPRTSLVFPSDFQVPPPPPPRMQSCHPDALSARGNPPPPPPQNQVVHAPYDPPTPDPRMQQFHQNPRSARQRPMTVYNQQWMLPPQTQHNEPSMMHFQGQPAHFIPVSASMGLPAPNQYQYGGQRMPQYPNYPRGYYRSRAPPTGDATDGESADTEDSSCDENKRVELFEKLKEIFHGEEEKICKVMEENPSEMSADKLASLMLG